MRLIFVLEGVVVSGGEVPSAGVVEFQSNADAEGRFGGIHDLDADCGTARDESRSGVGALAHHVVFIAGVNIGLQPAAIFSDESPLCLEAEAEIPDRLARVASDDARAARARLHIAVAVEMHIFGE